MWKLLKRMDLNILYVIMGLLVGGISGVTLMKSDVQHHEVTLYGTDEHPENGLANRVIVDEAVIKNINTNLSRIDGNIRDMNGKLDEVLMHKNVNYTEK